MVISLYRSVLAAVATACVLAAGGAADAQTRRPGGQLVHGSVEEPDRFHSGSF